MQYSGAVTGKGKPASGGLASTNPNYSPPACWYEPTYTPSEMQDWYNTYRGYAIKTQWPDRVGQLDKEYKKSLDDKHVKKASKKKGMYWAGVANPDRSDDPASDQCNKDPFWVPQGQAPKNVPLAVSPEILAKAAWGAINIPGVKLELSPKTKQTVNLDTWAWSNRAAIHPVSVTARLPQYGLWATTTATPSSLKIDPGTADAVTYPEGGVCAADKAGNIGVPFRKGDGKKRPPCGVRYEHASNNGPFSLKATITWTVSWKGSGDSHGDLPAGTFGSAQDVNVQEVQTVVDGPR